MQIPVRFRFYFYSLDQAEILIRFLFQASVFFAKRSRGPLQNLGPRSNIVPNRGLTQQRRASQNHTI